MVLPLVLALLAASCADIGDLFGSYGRLHEVRQRVAAVPGGAKATVTLADQRHLTIALSNDAIAMLSDGERQARALAIARAAYRAYFYRAALERVDVVAGDALKTLSFRTSLLVESASTPVAPAPPPSTPVHLYFVPIGEVREAMINDLASHFRARFSMPITVLARMSPVPATYNRSRKQINAVSLNAAMREQYADVMRDPDSRLIGITPDDMYFENIPRWQFTFSVRDGDHRAAVVSYARMDPGIFGNEPDDDLLVGRLRKMVAKDIGVMCYERALSDNPRSVLYGNILGTDELDVMTEEFDPVDLKAKGGAADSK